MEQIQKPNPEDYLIDLSNDQIIKFSLKEFFQKMKIDILDKIDKKLKENEGQNVKK